MFEAFVSSEIFEVVPTIVLVSWLIVLMSPFAIENMSKCQQIWDMSILEHLKEIDLLALSYMCLKSLACDDMIDFTGFHHILTSCEDMVVHVSNILYITMFLISTTQLESFDTQMP